MGGRIIRSPKEHSDIEPTLARSCQHLKERTATIGHLKAGPEKGDGDPHPRLGLINGITNPAKCRRAINERVDAIAGTDRVGTGGDKRNMSHARLHLLVLHARQPGAYIWLMIIMEMVKEF